MNPNRLIDITALILKVGILGAHSKPGGSHETLD